jgi:hypothetical protein
MQRGRVLAATAVLALAMLPGAVEAQQKTIKQQLAGTWNLLLVDEVKADGTHVPLYGPNPMGLLIFTPDGHYSLQIMRVGRPRYANLRTGGTPDENKAAVTGTISHFGTYSVDESAKAVTLLVEASSFPAWDGTKLTRVVTAITDEVLTYDNPTLVGEPASSHGELAWKKVK